MDKERLEELATELVKGVKSESDLANPLGRLMKLTIEKALNAELDSHLGYEKHSSQGRNKLNSRNGGRTGKKVITDAVLEEVEQRQNRPLESVYPIIYLDCIVVKVHQDKRVINKAVYLALGVTTEGIKELLGLWISENEGVKFWLSILTELHSQRCKRYLHCK